MPLPKTPQANSLRPESKPLMVDVKADLRERLLVVAIKLFAQRGVEAVSMRTINSEAGTKNKSAVHYHFGNKAGILAAIIAWVNERVEPALQDLWQQIAQRDDADDMSVYELLLVLYAPLIIIGRIPHHGSDVLKLWSKMLLDSTEGGFYMDDPFQSHFLAVVERLAQRLPDKNSVHLRFQVTHSVLAFLVGSATLGTRASTDIENAQMDDDKEMLFAFIDYTCGGISNIQTGQEGVNWAFWQSYFAKHDVVIGRSTNTSP